MSDQYHNLSYAYTVWPIVKRQRWMNEATPIGNVPHYQDYQVDGHIRDLHESHHYSHHHSHNRGMCGHHIDCPRGSVCRNGACVQPAKSNQDCPLGMHYLHGECRPEYARRSDSECSSGIANLDPTNKDTPQTCMLLSCRGDSDCPSGNCMVTHHGSFCGRPREQGRDGLTRHKKYHNLYGINTISQNRLF